MYMSSHATQPLQKTADDVLEKRCGLTTTELKALSAPSSLRFLLGVEYDIVLCVTEIGSQRGFTLTFAHFSETYQVLLSLCAKRFSLRCDHLEHGSVLSGVAVMPLLRYADYLPNALHVEELLAFLEVEPARHARRRTLPPLIVSRSAGGDAKNGKEEEAAEAFSGGGLTSAPTLTGRSSSGTSTNATSCNSEVKMSATVAAAMLANQFDASFLDYGEYTSKSESITAPGLGFYLMHDSGLSLATHSHLVLIRFHKGWTAAAALLEFQEFSGYQKFDLRFLDDHNHSAGGVIVMPSLQDAYDLFDRYEDEDSDDEGDLLPFVLRPVCPLVAVPSIEDTYLRRMREKYWFTVEHFWERFPNTRYCLMVSNLPSWGTLHNVLGWFDEHTMPLAEAKMVEDDSPYHRHRAFLTFRTAAAARRALDLDGKSVRGHTIRVQVAPPYISQNRWGRVIMSSQANSTNTSPALTAQRSTAASATATGSSTMSSSSMNHISALSPTSKTSVSQSTAATASPKLSTAPIASSNGSRNARCNGCVKSQSGLSSNSHQTSNSTSTATTSGSSSSSINNLSSSNATHVSKNSQNNGNTTGQGSEGRISNSEATNKNNNSFNNSHACAKNGKEAHDTKLRETDRVAPSASPSLSSAAAAVNSTVTTGRGGVVSAKSCTTTATESIAKRSNNGNAHKSSNSLPHQAELHAKEDTHANRKNSGAGQSGSAATTSASEASATAAAGSGSSCSSSSNNATSLVVRSGTCDGSGGATGEHEKPTILTANNSSDSRVHHLPPHDLSSSYSCSHRERPPLHRSPMLTPTPNHYSVKHASAAGMTGMMLSSSHASNGCGSGMMTLPQPRSRCKGDEEAHRTHTGENSTTAVRELVNSAGGLSYLRPSTSLATLAEASEALLLCNGLTSSRADVAHSKNDMNHNHNVAAVADVASGALPTASLSNFAPPSSSTVAAALVQSSGHLARAEVGTHNNTNINNVIVNGGRDSNTVVHASPMLLSTALGINNSSSSAGVSGPKDSAAIVAAAFASSALHVAGSAAAESKIGKTCSPASLTTSHGVMPAAPLVVSSASMTTIAGAASHAQPAPLTPPATGFVVASSNSLTAKSGTPSLMNADAKEFVPHFLLYPSVVATPESSYTRGVSMLGGGGIANHTSGGLSNTNNSMSNIGAPTTLGGMPASTLDAAAPVPSGFTVEGSGLLDSITAASLTSPPALPASLPSYSDVIQCCGGTAASGSLAAAAVAAGVAVGGDPLGTGYLASTLPPSSFTHEFATAGMVPPPYALPPPYMEFADPVFAGNSANKPPPHSAAATPKVNAPSLSATTLLTASASLAAVAPVLSSPPLCAETKTMFAAAATSSFRHGPMIAPPLPRSTPAATFAVSAASAPPPYNVPTL